MRSSAWSVNWWKDFHFDPPPNATPPLRGYDDVIDIAAEFGADQVFIDPVWEHGEAMRAEMEQLLPTEKRAGTAIALNHPPPGAWAATGSAGPLAFDLSRVTATATTAATSATPQSPSSRCASLGGT